MVDVIQQKMRLVLSLLLPMLFILVSGVSVALADGEESFEGIIEMIEEINAADAAVTIQKIAGKNYTHTITVKVTGQALSERTVDSKILLFIADDTRIFKLKKNHLKSVSIKKLSAGALIRIKPNTLPGKDVEADTIKIIRRAAK